MNYNILVLAVLLDEFQVELIFIVRKWNITYIYIWTIAFDLSLFCDVCERYYI